MPAIAVHLFTMEQAVMRMPTPAMLLQQSGFGAFLPIVLLFGIFFLLVIMPARKRQKKLEAMLANLSSGDQVVTNGGISGTIVGLADTKVTLRIPPDGTKLEFARNAVVGMADKPSN